MTAATRTPTGPRIDRRGTSSPTGPIGPVVVGSLITGFLAAALLVAAPVVPADESSVTGAVLCGLALGWAAMAVWSVRFTRQPQWWAAAPALFLEWVVSCC